MHEFKKSILQLVIETSSNLPPDVRRALQAAMDREQPAPSRPWRSIRSP